MRMRHDSAVSPVIGVLLMLTLTLILAAIVSSYAGGLVSTETKAPTVSLLVKYSNTTGLEIEDLSGDPVPTSSINLLIRPSDTMGSAAGRRVSQVNKSLITDLNGSSWTTGLSVMRPGDLHLVTMANITSLQPGIENQYLICNPENEGKTFFFEVYYKNSMIARNEVLIER